MKSEEEIKEEMSRVLRDGILTGSFFAGWYAALKWVLR